MGERVSDDGISFDQGSYRILGGATKQVNARLTLALPAFAFCEKFRAEFRIARDGAQRETIFHVKQFRRG